MANSLVNALLGRGRPVDTSIGSKAEWIDACRKGMLANIYTHLVFTTFWRCDYSQNIVRVLKRSYRTERGGA